MALSVIIILIFLTGGARGYLLSPDLNEPQSTARTGDAADGYSTPSNYISLNPAYYRSSGEQKTYQPAERYKSLFSPGTYNSPATYNTQKSYRPGTYSSPGTYNSHNFYSPGTYNSHNFYSPGTYNSPTTYNAENLKTYSPRTYNNGKSHKSHGISGHHNSLGTYSSRGTVGNVN